MDEEGYSAKAAARKLGIPDRVLRKFLRSDLSPFEAVGQGSRYIFDEEDMIVLERAFRSANPRKAQRKHDVDPIDIDPAEDEVADDDEFFDLEDLDDPTPDELEALDTYTEELD